MIESDHPLAERIRNLIPLNSLEARLQAEAFEQGEIYQFKKKKTVFEEGSRDPYTYYLLDGELELQTSAAAPARMRAGDDNARRAIAQLQPRRYTAVALTEATLFRIERGVLDRILSDEQVLEN